MYKIERLYFVALVLFASCMTRSTLMTRESFDTIYLGMPANDLASQVGEPYAKHSKGPGTKEYEYIEKMCFGVRCTAETHYYLMISEGKVVGKRITYEKLPPYNLIYEDDPNALYP